MYIVCPQTVRRRMRVGEGGGEEVTEHLRSLALWLAMATVAPAGQTEDTAGPIVWTKRLS